MLQRRRSIRSNLDDVAEVIRRESPNVVALQEADGPSAWSGQFDHVRYLAEAGGLDYAVQGQHVNGATLRYGTALLAERPLRDPISVAFRRSPPSFSKGFVASSLDWPGFGEQGVDVVSLHLDFLRNTVRHRQVRQVIEALGDCPRPLVVMGDFNCTWKQGRTPLNLFAEELELRAFEPYADELVTFAKTNRRLDWILVSPELEFVSHRILNDPLSDHYAVVAEIRRARSPGVELRTCRGDQFTS